MLSYKFGESNHYDALYRVLGFSDYPVDSVLVMKVNEEDYHPTKRVYYFSKHHLIKVRNVKLAKLLYE